MAEQQTYFSAVPVRRPRRTRPRHGGTARRFVSELGTQWAVAPKIGKVALPVNLPFVIVDVDPSSHMLCSGGLDSWMYLMTRQTQPSDMLIQTCLAKAAAAGFDMGKVLVVQQTTR